MKFFHLSDLHIGKRLNEFSLLDDQRYILSTIVNIVAEEKPDGIIIAGDIYDKSIPSAEAALLFDDFLVKLSEKNVKIFVISGNHDSAERIAFGGRLMEGAGVYMSPVYNGKIKAITLEDLYGKINVYMLPFVKPAHVRRFFPDAEIEDYTMAVKTAIDNVEINQDERNVLICHQFIVGATKSESEEVSVGGLDQVDAGIFEPFDYVALGHIHGPQSVGKDTVRYCGTPLKYSFSEAKHQKSITVVELKEKGKINIDLISLKPKRDLIEISGAYDELTSKDYYEKLNLDDYYKITLTDKEEINNAMGLLRLIYPNLMRLEYDNERTRAFGQVKAIEDIEEKSQLDIFKELYEKQNNSPMSLEQESLALELIEEIWEEQK